MSKHNYLGSPFAALIALLFALIGLWEHGLIPYRLRRQGWFDVVNVGWHWYGRRKEWDKGKGRVVIDG